MPMPMPKPKLQKPHRKCGARCRNAQVVPFPCTCQACGGAQHGSATRTVDHLVDLIGQKLSNPALPQRDHALWNAIMAAVLDTAAPPRRHLRAVK